MGLDMYFYKAGKDVADKIVEAHKKRKEIYDAIPNFYDSDRNHWTDEQVAEAARWAEKYTEATHKAYEIIDEQCEEIMYFRKFNGLHGFIIRELNDDVDDCSPIILDHCALKCIRAVLNHDKELIEKSKLPDSYVHLNYDTVQLKPVAGFFFGDTSLGKYWEDDVNAGADKVNDIIENLADDEVVVYLASW